MTLLATDDVAVAYGFDLLWARARDLPPTATSFELRDIAREQWEQFREQAERTEHIAAGFGWSLNAAWTHTEDVKLAQGDLSQVERVARLAGRMYVALRGAQARKIHGVPSEVYSVEQGNDLARLLPSEQVLLCEPVFEIAALERIASRRAAQYAVRGTTKVSKGPLVIALDESGSMGGEKNEWAKAAAVALSRVAMEEKRPVCVVHYSTSTVLQPLPSGDTGALLKMIRHFLGRGTAIGLALGVAVQQVRDLAQKGQKGADVILVTDGIDGDVAAQEAALYEGHVIGARLWTVAIECDIPESRRSARRRRTTSGWAGRTSRRRASPCSPAPRSPSRQRAARINRPQYGTVGRPSAFFHMKEKRANVRRGRRHRPLESSRHTRAPRRSATAR